MGAVIQKNAARADIVADLNTTVERAQPRGAAWLEGIQKFLLAILALITRNQTTLEAAQKALRESHGAADWKLAEIGDRIATVHDDLYNVVGRPGQHSDALWLLLFPHAAATIRGLPLQEQPTAIALVVDLLRERVHPKISAEVADEAVAELEACAAELQAVATPLAAAKVKVDLLDKTAGVLAKAGQVQLADLKRFWKALRFSEADIHDVIPDRPRTTKKGDEDDEQPPSGAV
jgi:hypothetical protein